MALLYVCSPDPDVVAQARRIAAAVASAGPLAGLLLRIDRPVA